jgi:hypothetical protein
MDGMEKPSSGSRAPLFLLDVESGSHRLRGGVGDLGFGTDPVLYIVPILAAALLIQFICPTANSFL